MLLKNFRPFLILALFSAVLAGCATAPKRTAPAESEQVAAMQNELQAKDQQIQDLQYRLQGYEQAIPSGGNYSKTSSKNKYIRVSGVSVEDVQKALTRNGFDPGPADGRIGKKTKSAIKSFQRQHGLKADGVVGEKTWSYLKS